MKKLPLLSLIGIGVILLASVINYVISTINALSYSAYDPAWLIGAIFTGNNLGVLVLLTVGLATRDQLLLLIGWIAGGVHVVVNLIAAIVYLSSGALGSAGYNVVAILAAGAAGAMALILWLRGRPQRSMQHGQPAQYAQAQQPQYGQQPQHGQQTQYGQQAQQAQPWDQQQRPAQSTPFSSGPEQPR